MDISSATNVPLQINPTAITPNNANADKVEGTTPDNDNDRDDAAVTSTAATPATNTTTDTLGTKINVTA